MKSTWTQNSTPTANENLWTLLLH